MSKDIIIFGILYICTMIATIIAIGIENDTAEVITLIIHAIVTIAFIITEIIDYYKN